MESKITELTGLKAIHEKVKKIPKYDDEFDYNAIKCTNKDIDKNYFIEVSEKLEKISVRIISINRTPIKHLTNPIRDHMKLDKTINISATFWTTSQTYGVQSIILTFRDPDFDTFYQTYCEDEKEKIKEKIKEIKIYSNKVYVSYHQYNRTSIGSLHYLLFNESSDKELIKLSGQLFDFFKMQLNEKKPNQPKQTLSQKYKTRIVYNT